MIDLAVLDVVADVLAGEVCADGVDNRLRGDAFAFAGCRIHLQSVFGIVLGVGCRCRGDLRASLQFFGKLVAQVDEGLVVAASGAVLQVKFHHGTCTVSRDLRHLEWGDGRLRQVHHRPDVNALLHVGDAVERTFFPVFQPHHHGGVIGTGTAVHHRITGDAAHQLGVVKSAHVVLQLVEGCFRFVEVGARRHGDIHQQEALVLLRHEVFLCCRHQPDHSTGEGGQQNPRKCGLLDEFGDAAHIFLLYSVIGRVIGGAHVVVQVLFLGFAFLFRFEQQGTQGGTDGQGRYGRQGHGSRHDGAELFEESAGSARHEGHGDEHRHEDQCGGDTGGGYFAECVVDSGAGALVTCLQLGHHGLHDHDGVIHDRTDGQHQGEECQQVEGETHHFDDGEGADQGDDDGDGRHDGGLQVLQEDIHDQNHQDDGDDERFQHTVHRSVKEVVGCFQLFEFQTGGQRLRDFLEVLVDFGVHLGGVGARGLVDDEQHAGMPVDVGAVVVCFGAEFHIGHIGQTQHPSVRAGTDDDVFELAHVVEQSIEFDVNLVDGAFKTADRGDDILFVDGRDNLVGRDSISAHDVGFEPDTHAVLVAEHLGAAHARDTADGRHDIDVQIV